MKREIALRWSWIHVLNRKRYDMLRESFGDLDRAFEELTPEMLSELGCKEETVHIAFNRLDEFDVDSYEIELKKRGLVFQTCEDADFPRALLEIPDAPVFLYSKGDLSILNQPCLALVGTREMSDYGKRVVSHLIPDIVQAGLVTISGLAFGIDAEVARETLRAGGKTVAVVGHGLAMIYPKANERLAEEIVQKGGLILSEFPLDTNPDKFTFPARNRIIAGLSLGTVVVEAAEASGSLITAELALEYGRDVFAVPGPIFDPNFVGCHELIGKGQAKLITSAQDILSDLGIVASNRAQSEEVYTPESTEEAKIFEALTSMPSNMDELAEKTLLDIATLNAVLTILEMRGAAKNVGTGVWVRG